MNIYIKNIHKYGQKPFLRRSIQAECCLIDQFFFVSSCLKTSYFTFLILSGRLFQIIAALYWKEFLKRTVLKLGWTICIDLLSVFLILRFSIKFAIGDMHCTSLYKL